ncbi:lysostaphin resistance A-like protein [Flavobacterium sp.]|jgi:membrane protease YdiL (CAAX protease family)|uniref:lysostaphin resistance A-like protein n=1 Tax=Flavobacterium sp. TaxID=239 RepID=UPI0037C1139C
MFIKQAFQKETDSLVIVLNFFKYLGGSFMVFLAALLGQIPLSVAMFFSGKMPQSTEEMYQALDANVFLALSLFSFLCAFVGLYLVVVKLHHQKFVTIITSRAKVDWKRVFLSFSVWSLVSIVAFFSSYLLDPGAIMWQFKPLPFLFLCCITIVLMPVQTTTEELVFRGYLMQGFYNLAQNKWFPLLITSIIFGTMHIFNPEVEKMGYLILVYYIGTGLFLGVITLMDEGTELALGFHAANNIVASLLVTTDFTVFQTPSIFKDISEPSISFEIFIPVLVLFPTLVYLFSKIYKWNNWRDKLLGLKAQTEKTIL